MNLNIFLEETNCIEGSEQTPVYKIWVFFSYLNLKLFRGYVATNDVYKTIRKYQEDHYGAYVIDKIE